MRWEVSQALHIRFRRVICGRTFYDAKKGQVEPRPGLLGESAQNKLPASGSIFCPFFVVVGAPPCVAHKPRVPKQ
jgi:hypothetical protein